jgi:hypothetical protein
MLETASLLIHPWQHTGDHGWSRLVVDAATASALGRVGWLGPPERSWFDWLHGQRLEVLETDDAALLMTLVRSWGLTRWWDVYDAEERRIGTIAPPVLLDSEGGRRAYLDRADRHNGRLLSPEPRILADYARQSDEAILLRFSPDLDANPFLRMLLLGCVLIDEVPPRTRAERRARQAR